MNTEEKKRELALYRLQQAEESLDEAKFLFEGNKSPRSVINRAYYAMFYSVLAMLVFEEYSSSKHAVLFRILIVDLLKMGLSLKILDEL